jgi:hypothetical protein
LMEASRRMAVRNALRQTNGRCATSTPNLNADA